MSRTGIGLSIAGGLLIIFILLKVFKKPSMGANDNVLKMYESYFKPYNLNMTGNIGNDVISFILHKEGGLSDQESDSAHTHPTGVPFTNPVNGRTSSLWHTNKGITWQSFSELSHTLGFDGSVKKFYEMPFETWKLIYDKGYLKYAQKTNDEKINYLLSLWVWGSGAGGEDHLLKAFEEHFKAPIKTLLSQWGEKTLLTELVKWRIDFFNLLSDKKIKAVKNNSAFSEEHKEKLIKDLEKVRGAWINEMLNFFKYFVK